MPALSRGLCPFQPWQAALGAAGTPPVRGHWTIGLSPATGSRGFHGCCAWTLKHVGWGPTRGLVGLVQPQGWPADPPPLAPASSTHRFLWEGVSAPAGAASKGHGPPSPLCLPPAASSVSQEESGVETGRKRGVCPERDPSSFCFTGCGHGGEGMGCAEALGRSRTPQSPLGAAFAPVPVQAEASSYRLTSEGSTGRSLAQTGYGA